MEQAVGLRRQPEAELPPSAGEASAGSVSSSTRCATGGCCPTIPGATGAACGTQPGTCDHSCRFSPFLPDFGTSCAAFRTSAYAAVSRSAAVAV